MESAVFEPMRYQPRSNFLPPRDRSKQHWISSTALNSRSFYKALCCAVRLFSVEKCASFFAEFFQRLSSKFSRPSSGAPHAAVACRFSTHPSHPHARATTQTCYPKLTFLVGEGSAFLIIDSKLSADSSLLRTFYFSVALTTTLASTSPPQFPVPPPSRTPLQPLSTKSFSPPPKPKTR
jgi:hypothetical protein